MEEGSAVSLSLLFFEHKKICMGDFASDAVDCHSILSDETVGAMVQREGAHLPRDDYLKKLRSVDSILSVRKQALDWIYKAHAYFGYGPWSFFLSVNYLDRFLSLFELPIGISWTGQLFAVTCLSIAAKMGEIKVPQSVHLQVGQPKFTFEAITIQKMELLVLSTLGWKMQALIPCSFIDYFISKITSEQHQMKASISKSVELMLSIIIDFLEFRPSEIAAAVAISVTRELEAEEIHKALSCLVMVKEERVLKCLELMRNLSLVNVSGNLGSNLAPSVSQSAVGMLDGACSSSKSDELTVGSCSNSSIDNNPNAKRQRSEPSDETCKS